MPDTSSCAFPAEQHETQDGNWNQTFDPGMTMHDYFAAHAPSEPQHWFLPAIPPKPEIPYWKELSEPARKEWLDEKLSWADPEDCLPEYVAFSERYKAARLAMEEWEREYEKARCTQWPYAWADEQLKERNK